MAGALCGYGDDNDMSRRPAAYTQAEVARAIRAAKQAGATEVEVHAADRSKIVIRLQPSPGADAAPEEHREIKL